MGKKMEIFVRDLLSWIPKPKTLTLKVEPTDTVLSVMEQIEARLGTPPILQRLMFQGLMLLHDAPGTLADHKVVHDSSMTVMDCQFGWNQLKDRTLRAMGFGNDLDDNRRAAMEFAKNDDADEPVQQQLEEEEEEEEEAVDTDKMQIVVEDYIIRSWPKPRAIRLDVEASDTVASVMAQVQHSLLYPPAMQVLHYDGRRMCHERGGTLADYGVEEGSVLVLLMSPEFAIAADVEERKRNKDKNNAADADERKRKKAKQEKDTHDKQQQQNLADGKAAAQ